MHRRCHRVKGIRQHVQPGKVSRQVLKKLEGGRKLGNRNRKEGSCDDLMTRKGREWVRYNRIDGSYDDLIRGGSGRRGMEMMMVELKDPVMT